MCVCVYMGESLGVCGDADAKVGIDEHAGVCAVHRNGFASDKEAEDNVFAGQEDGAPRVEWPKEEGQEFCGMNGLWERVEWRKRKKNQSRDF